MKIKSIVLAVIFCLMGLWIYNLNKNKAHYKAMYENNELAKQDTIEYYKTQNGRFVAEKRSYLTDKKNLITANDSLKDVLKNIKPEVVTIIKTVVKIDTVKIPFEKPIPIDFYRTWNHNTKWFSIDGSVTQEGVNINNLSLPDKLDFIGGWKKQNWFKPDIPTIRVVNSNPHVQISNMEGYVFNEKVPLIKSKGFNIAIGVGLGFLICNTIK